MRLQPPISEAATARIFNLFGTQDEFGDLHKGLALLGTDPRVRLNDGDVKVFDRGAISGLQESLAVRTEIIMSDERSRRTFEETDMIPGLSLDEVTLAGAALARVAQMHAAHAEAVSQADDPIPSMYSACQALIAGWNAQLLFPEVRLPDIVTT